MLAHLLGRTRSNPALIDEEVFIVAVDLTPLDTLQLNKKYVKAFVSDIGGRTAHRLIMARSLEICAVVGTDDVSKKATNGETISVDGLTGEVVFDPTLDEVL